MCWARTGVLRSWGSRLRRARARILRTWSRPRLGARTGERDTRRGILVAGVSWRRCGSRLRGRLAWELWRARELGNGRRRSERRRRGPGLRARRRVLITWSRLRLCEGRLRERRTWGWSRLREGWLRVRGTWSWSRLRERRTWSWSRLRERRLRVRRTWSWSRLRERRLRGCTCWSCSRVCESR